MGLGLLCWRWGGCVRGGLRGLFVVSSAALWMGWCETGCRSWVLEMLVRISHGGTVVAYWMVCLFLLLREAGALRLREP